jgi:DNA-binding MarR family transcriptional regulator
MDTDGKPFMSAPLLNQIIHAPNRLQICAFLEPLEEAEFVVLRDYLEISDSVLSKQIKILEEAGYIQLTKRVESGRQRTWVALTKEGYKAFQSYIKELRKIVG